MHPTQQTRRSTTPKPCKIDWLKSLNRSLCRRQSKQMKGRDSWTSKLSRSWPKKRLESTQSQPGRIERQAINHWVMRGLLKNRKRRAWITRGIARAMEPNFIQMCKETPASSVSSTKSLAQVTLISPATGKLEWIGSCRGMEQLIPVHFGRLIITRFVKKAAT